ncbi:MAG: hypothetical protein EP326_13760 [Deltaproteobacteria bacterium]|nr:MAG: hypothetical protein EP326_13760 [Deltaproteobacteria bacterium]
MKKILLVISVLCGLNLANATATPPEIENFDIRYYDPSNYGLRDLVFEMRMSNLVETMKQRLQIKDLVDVYFKIYWMYPGKYKVDVEGLPAGFKEIKSELKAMVKNRLDFVIPEKLSPKVRSYELKAQKSKKGTTIVGTDKTHTRAVNEIRLSFDGGGKLTGFKTMSPMGVNTSEMKMSAKSWSHNKWVVDRLIVKSIQGIQMTEINHDVEYENVDGFGFPKKVEVMTTRKLVKPESVKSKDEQLKLKTEVMFSKYEVNTGKAQRYITQGLRK